MKNKLMYLLGAAVGAFPYVAALWMLLRGVNSPLSITNKA